MNGEDTLKKLAALVAEDKLLLRDDRQNLVSRQDLEAILKGNGYTDGEVGGSFANRLILPVDESEEQPYHVGITLDFLSFQRKLHVAGFPVRLQQSVAKMYYPLYWAMSTDVEYEVSKFEDERGRSLSKLELAHLRVISEWAATNMIIRIEDRILRLEPEGDTELKELIKAEWQRRQATRKKARFGFEESKVAEVVAEVWQPPLLWFQGREMKAFINLDTIDCTRHEDRLLWGGHFDFALCDGHDVLQLAVEYHGGGHYGKSEPDKTYAESRDNAKRSICNKAAVPLVVLTTEFAYRPDHRELFKNFLLLLRDKLDAIDREALCDHISAALGVQETLLIAERLGVNVVHGMADRLWLWKAQRRIDMLLALLWEVRASLEDFTGLHNALNALGQ